MSGMSALRRLKSATKTSLAVVGLGTTIYAAREINEYNKIRAGHGDGSDKKKKGILVLPFHRMKIVEQKKPSLLANLAQVQNGDEIIEVELRELVEAIHAAAVDPYIVALHGIFGHGFKFQCGGYAHVEEIRNAIRVFNESHRRHHEGKSSSDNSRQIETNAGADTALSKKISYAYADSFDSPGDPGNKEYFLASAFSQVHMQPRGNMNLFGASMSHCFLADAFKKYGINCHVFKKGKYKNAPNSASESGYTKPHYENTRDVLDSINNTVYASIAQSRLLPRVFDNAVWKSIHDYGTMTADNAQEIKLIDYLPQVNPIFDLIQMNKGKKGKKTETLQEKWSSILSKANFEANDMISLYDYNSKLQSKKKWQKRQSRMYQMVKNASSVSTATELMLNILGYGAPYFFWEKEEVDEVLNKFTKDKIAVVHVSGAIDNSVAKKVTQALRDIKKDEHFKCVVLRVDSPGGGVTASETILEECKDIGRPVVCSFSNLAASGGYYVSVDASKIFALKTTLTGSIGVFGVKFDATDAAKRYGIEFDSVTSGAHAQTNSPFHPLTLAMKTNLSRNMDRVYNYFKQIVADGRDMPLDEVEKVAQGRVWTGEQAKEVNLIDEFGGIQRAIDFAKTNYTSGGMVEVEVFPKQKSLRDRLQAKPEIGMELKSLNTQECFVHSLLDNVLNGTVSRASPSSIVLCMDETSAMQTITREACEQSFEDVI